MKNSIKIPSNFGFSRKKHTLQDTFSIYCLLNHGSNTTAVSLLTTSKHFSREKLCYAFKLYTIIALSLFFLYFFDHKVNKRVKKCAKMSLNYLSHKFNAVIFPNLMVSRHYILSMSKLTRSNPEKKLLLHNLTLLTLNGFEKS